LDTYTKQRMSSRTGHRPFPVLGLRLRQQVDALGHHRQAAPLEHGQVQRFLAGEVIVQAAQVDVGDASHHARAGSDEAVLGEGTIA